MDGTLGTSRGITTAPSTTRTKIGLGQNPDLSPNTMNGHIRRFIYWPRAISDASLVAYSSDLDIKGGLKNTGILSLSEMLQVSYDVEAATP